MNAQGKLARLAEIDGFLGAALFSPEGRLLAKCEPADVDLKLIGTLANNVLNHIQKTSLDMDLGRSHSACIQTEKALILLRCLNEGGNPLHAEPGKCHIHLVLLVDNPDSLGIARLEISQVIESLAEDFRMPEALAHRKKTAPPSKQRLQEAAASLDTENVGRIFDGLLA
jgi:predicted regulator of Ras-like GTPase activity (Roadblock/LC7/MglB family)